MRRAIAWLACAQAWGCSDHGASGSGGSGDVASDGDEQRPAPIFVEPADGELVLPVTRVAPVELAVDFVLPGLTELYVDERTVGTLGADEALGDLGATHLRLAMGGGMVPAAHVLQLITPGPEHPLHSQRIDLIFEAVEAEPPTARAEATVLGTGDVLVPGDGGAVVLVDTAASPPRARVFVDDPEQGFAAEPVLERDLDGLVSGSRSTLAVQHRGDGDRLAWLAGDDGDEIRTAVGTAPTTVAMAAADFAAGLEWTRLSAPIFVGDALMAALVASADVERPTPGDRRLLLSPAPDRAAFELDVGQTGDLIWLAPVLDARAGVDGRLGVLLALDSELLIAHWNGSRATLETDTVPIDDGGEALAVDPDAIATAVQAAFGSLTIPRLAGTDFAIDRLEILATRAATRLPAEPPLPAISTAPPALMVLDGSVLFFVPLGDAEPVHVVAATAPAPGAVALAGIHCDAVAAASATRTEHGELLCLRGRELVAVRVTAP